MSTSYDSNGNVVISVNNNGHALGSDQFVGAIVNVATAGKSVQLPSYPCREVTVIAKKSNKGSIYVGESNVSASMYGVELASNESFTFSISNANLIWIDASAGGDGISYIAL